MSKAVLSIRVYKVSPDGRKTETKPRETYRTGVSWGSLADYEPCRCPIHRAAEAS
ncbi:hypothetical protein ACIRPK_03725 [Kitasatospora sp. NPDC101801]|uniref:hypothetical protein n=1 Tax=Kitasatospora sp. NPDC101801 TaxID=3364103 RepID=UPI00382910AE